MRPATRAMRCRLLDLPLDDDEVVVDNAPIRRHKHDGLTIEGYSKAAVQSYWRIPELKIGFDFGLQPWSFMATPTYALSHGHLDHVAALPIYVARRRMMRMPEPTIFLPEPLLDPVNDLLDAYQRLDRGRMPCFLEPCCPGDEFDLSRELILSCYRTHHTVPSLGYMVYHRKRKLKAKYLGLQGEEIRDLRQKGVEVTNEVRTPVVGYLGDSNPHGLDACEDNYRAQVLIMEITFVAAGHRREKIHKYGHIHWHDVLDRADQFENELIIAGHFSTRYHDDQVRRMIEKTVPDVLKDRLLLWL